MDIIKEHYYQIGTYHFKFLECDNKFMVIYGKDIEIGSVNSIQEAVDLAELHVHFIDTKKIKTSKTNQ